MTGRSFLLMLTLLGLLVGCNAAHNAERLKTEKKDMLLEVAKGYWTNLRWGDVEKAAAYVPDGPERGQLWDYLVAHRGRASLNEVEVYRVEVSEDQKTGTAYVTYQLIIPTAESVQNRQIKQNWFMQGGHWFLQIDAEELSRLD